MIAPRWLALLALLTLVAPVTPAAAQSAAPTVRGLEVVGTELRVVFTDGTHLPRDKLIGAVLTFVNAKGMAQWFRVDAIEVDARDDVGDVLLYSLTTPDASGAWVPLCGPDPDGRHLAISLAGAWDEDGNPVAGGSTPAGAFTPALTSGALGKCVRFGYKPWKTVNGACLNRHHAACMRMVRGDYGGTGEPFTRDGMRIDVYRPGQHPGARQ